MTGRHSRLVFPTPGLTSIIIPTYQHGRYLLDAIDSALGQTAPVEVIVVDDGSTDDTEAILRDWPRHNPRLRVARQAHAGPSAARNHGLTIAAGEFVMFLDADDVLARTKVAEQLAAFDDQVGWVLCDVAITDELTGRRTTASDRYRYAQRQIGGWIARQLEPSNFIPIMAPLVRRSALEAGRIRFHDQPLEDWDFWYQVAKTARVRYVPRVLATYRKRRTGRNRGAVVAPPVLPNVEAPLRLNLGCGTPGALSWHPMPGLVNLDRSMGWCFEDGLPQFADASVAGITVSHALMYVEAEDWPRVFREFARVLAPGGVLRITEDETHDPASSRVGGWRGSEPAVTLTTPAFVKDHLQRAGLVAHDVDAATTHYADRSLCQAQHGAPPDVFFVEGVKP